jgi:cytochrome c-type biogenesis protein
MSLTPLSLLAVFGAGLLSFLSPCVVALVPGYLAYLSGMSLEEVNSQPSAR